MPYAISYKDKKANRHAADGTTDETLRIMLLCAQGRSLAEIGIAKVSDGRSLIRRAKHGAAQSYLTARRLPLRGALEPPAFYLPSRTIIFIF